MGGAITVVVADRGRTVSSQVRAALEPLGYKVVHVQSCHQAFEALRSRESAPSFFLVALSVADGSCWDVFESVERSAVALTCPIAIVTTSVAVMRAHARSGAPWPLLSVPVRASELLALITARSGTFLSAEPEELAAVG